MHASLRTALLHPLFHAALQVSLVWGAVGLSSRAHAQSPLTAVCGDCRPEKVARCGGFLEGPAFDAQGGLWVVDPVGDRVLSVDEQGECQSRATLQRGKENGAPNGSKFGTDGRLYIASRHGIQALEPATGKRSEVVRAFAGQPLENINDLTFDAQGGLYFTVPGSSSALKANGRAFYLAPGARAPVLLSDQLAFPNGITLSPDGQTVLVGEFAAKRIVSIPSPPSTSLLKLTYVYAMTRGGIGPDGLTVDPKGRLFAANFGSGEVLVFSSEGVPLDAIRLPGDAGRLVTNVALHDSALYITEAEKGEVWRVRLK